MDREYKRLPFYVQKTDDERGIVDAIVAVMGNVDHQHDVIDPGSFRKTISERARKIRILDNHQARSVRDVVGKPLSFREMGRNELPTEVLTQYPDATGGLFASIQFLMDTPEGSGVYRRIKSNAVNEYSIGYDALDTMPDVVVRDGEETHVRRLKTIRLWEVSPVIWGANPATSTLAAKDDNGKQTPLIPVETAYSCECPKCGHELESKTPCDEVKCPECGTMMEGQPLAVEPEKADVEPSEDKPAPEVTENTIRIRVRDPADFQQDSFRVINIGDADNGIQATIGRLTGETSTTTQSYIFDKDKWTVARAQSWVDNHKSEEVDVDEKDADDVAELDEKAIWTRRYINDLSDASFLYIEPGGEKDDEDKTTPRTLRHFPYKDANGSIDIPHLRNAIGRIPQSNAEGLTAARKERLQERARGLLEDAQKSADDDPEQKEGRVLARRNAERIGNALARLMEVFEDAGIEIPGFSKEPIDKDEDEKSETAPVMTRAAKADGGEQKRQDEAGSMVEATDALPHAPPTFDSTSLLRAIDIELEEIQLVEV